MAYKVSKVNVWAADILNRPGTLARLLESLAGGGAQLEFLISRQATARTSRVFVAPLRGTRQTRAARDAGLIPTRSMYALRIEGPDRPGLGAAVARSVAAAAINIRGLSAANIGRRGVLYIALETPEDAKKAAAILRRKLGGSVRTRPA